MTVDLSIVIVSWNTRDLLRNCLASLPGACVALDFETIVVDNSSSDGSEKMVVEEFPDTQLIQSGENLGFSRGNNRAFEHCRGDFILLLNPDTVCPPSSLALLLDWARKKENLGAVSPLLTNDQGVPTITYGYFPSPRFYWLGFLDPLRLLPGRYLQSRTVCIPKSEDPSGKVEYIAGACFLIPRTAFEKIGPLDERFFMYFEETDWCWRARLQGLDIWYFAGARIAHLEGQSAQKASSFSTMQYQQSLRLFVSKNYGPGHVWKFRLAQFLEFTLKGVLRSLIPWHREQNRSLAKTYFLRAKLQMASRIAPPIP